MATQIDFRAAAGKTIRSITDGGLGFGQLIIVFTDDTFAQIQPCEDCEGGQWEISTDDELYPLECTPEALEEAFGDAGKEMHRLATEEKERQRELIRKQVW